MWAIPSYFTMVMVGFIVCILLLRREALQNNWTDAPRIIDFGLWIILASLLGARLAHVLFDGYLWDYIYLCIDPTKLSAPLPGGGACTDSIQCLNAQNAGYDIGGQCIGGVCIPERSCLRPLMFWSGGLTYYGGLIAALGTAVFLCRRWKWSFLKLADMTAPFMALGLSFGRLGCFLAGCCFGSVTNVPWAIRFPMYSDAWRRHRDLFPTELANQAELLHEHLSLPVHPTQLYECFGTIIIGLILWLFRKKTSYKGQKLAWFLISYAILRFIIEFFRDDARGGWILSTSQWIGIGMAALGIGLMIIGHHRTANHPDNMPEDSGNMPEDSGSTPEDSGNMPEDSGNMP